MSAQPKTGLSIGGYEPFELGLGAPPPLSGIGSVDPMLPRFVFSPFLNLDLSTERIIPRYIRPAAITMIRPFERHEQDFTYVGTEELIPLSESLFYHADRMRTVPPGDVEKTLQNLYQSQGTLPTGFTVLMDLLGKEPDKRSQDWDLIRGIMDTFLPNRPKDSIDQLKMIGDGLKLARDEDPVYMAVGRNLLTATEQGVEWCRNHLYGPQGTEWQLEQTAIGHGGNGIKTGLSKFDKRVCKWLRVGEPRITTRLSHDPGQIAQQAVQAAAPGIDSATIAQITASTVLALREAGFLNATPVQAPIQDEIPLELKKKD